MRTCAEETQAAPVQMNIYSLGGTGNATLGTQLVTQVVARDLWIAEVQCEEVCLGIVDGAERRNANAPKKAHLKEDFSGKH